MNFGKKIVIVNCEYISVPNLDPIPVLSTGSRLDPDPDTLNINLKKTTIAY